MKRGTISFLSSAKIAFLLGLLSGTLSASESALLPEAEFPLGRMQLPETRTERTIRPGVTHIHVERGWPLAGDQWAIVSGWLTEQSVVDSLRACLQRSGLRVQEDWFQAPLGDEKYCFLSAGDFFSRKEATEVLAKLTCGGPLQVRHRASLLSWTTGPWSFDIIIIDPAHYQGRIVAAREPSLMSTSGIVRKHHGVVGINGSLFDGYVRPGFPACELPRSSGSSIIQGQWYNEADDGPVLFVENENGRSRLWIEQPQTSIPVPEVKWADGKASPLTGINRSPRTANELIAMRAEIFEYWQKTETIPDESLFVQVSKDGSLARFSEAQQLAPENLVLLGTGHWREKLGTALENRERINLSLEVRGRLGLNAFRGGPILVKAGVPVRDDWWHPRSARTAVGVDAQGKIYLLVIDGNQYEPSEGGRGGSIGASISELREVMYFLGAVNALPLSGGGSSVMVINGEVVNRPYEPLASEENRRVERAVLDALLLVD